jgi:hypothetical protein
MASPSRIYEDFSLAKGVGEGAREEFAELATDRVK